MSDSTGRRRRPPLPPAPTRVRGGGPGDPAGNHAPVFLSSLAVTVDRGIRTARPSGPSARDAGHAPQSESHMMYDMVEYPSASDVDDEIHRALQDALNRRD